MSGCCSSHSYLPLHASGGEALHPQALHGATGAPWCSRSLGETFHSDKVSIRDLAPRSAFTQQLLPLSTPSVVKL